MNSSETTTELSKALAKAQLKMKNPNFDAQNPHFRSKYASLVSVREAVLPVLNQHGLSVAQFPKCTPGYAGCVNRLMHDSGEWLEEECLLPLDKATAHGAGSAITYARRYSLQSIAGVVADEDDDGNAASNSKPQTAAKPVTADVWDTLPADEQKRLQFIADCARAAMDKDGPESALSVIKENKLDADETVALWSRFDSKERSALKGVNKKAA